MKSKLVFGIVIGAVALIVAVQAVVAVRASQPVVRALQQSARAGARNEALAQTKKVASALVVSAYQTKAFPTSLNGIDLSGLALQLNPKLAGASLRTIKNPAKTVLVYEGAPGAPLFRHDGKAVLGFADGHAQLMNAKTVQAQNLHWEP